MTEEEYNQELNKQTMALLKATKSIKVDTPTVIQTTVTEYKHVNLSCLWCQWTN